MCYEIDEAVEGNKEVECSREMGIIGEKRRFESVELSVVGGKSVNDTSGNKLETSDDDDVTGKDAELLYTVKRAISSADDQESSLVHVTYQSLPRKSKKKLEEVLLGWAEWHSQNFKNDSNEELESGKESYYPALHLGSDSFSTLSFLSDVPLLKKHCKGLTGIDKEIVPLYDRGYTAPLCLDNSGTESKSLAVREDTRCFNCGAYDHSLKDCSKPRDNDAITNARKQYQTKHKGNGRSQIPTRYFQDTPAGKYDGLKQGSLSAETRQLLGIGELEQPPWHRRMQELGHPPGNAVVETKVEERPSGIRIITGDDDESMEVENNDSTGSMIPKTVKINSVYSPETNMNIQKAKHHVPADFGTLHPRGVGIPSKMPNYVPRTELYYRRQMPDPSLGDRDLRISRSFGVTSALDPFCAERDFRHTKHIERFGNGPPENLFRDDRDYMDARFSGSLRHSPPRHDLPWADRDYRDHRFSRNLGFSPSPKYFSRSYPSNMTDGPLRVFPQDRYMSRSHDIRGSFHSVDEGFTFHSPREQLPFSLSPPDNSTVFPNHQTYGRHYLHNGY